MKSMRYILGIALSLFLIANSVWAEEEQRPEEENLPMPETVEAYKAVVDPVLHWTPQDLSGKKNAIDLVEKIAARIDMIKKEHPIYDKLIGKEIALDLSVPEIAALDKAISDDKEMRKWLDELATCDYILRKEPSYIVFFSDMQYLGSMRRISNHLMLCIDLQMHHGEYEQAVHSIVIGKKLSVIGMHARPVMIDALVSLSISAGMNEEILENADLLKEGELQTLLGVLPDDEKVREAEMNTLRCEFWRFGVDLIRRKVVGKNQVEVPGLFVGLQTVDLESAAYKKAIDETVASFAQVMSLYYSIYLDEKLAHLDDEAMLEKFNEKFSPIIESAAADTLKVMEIMERGESLTSQERVIYLRPLMLRSAWFTTQMVIPSLDVFRRAFDNSENRRNATRIILAWHIYKHDHLKKAREATLQDLVDAKILKEMPLDVYTGKPMQFDAKQGIIWSVGMDRENNNAKPPHMGYWAEEGEDDVWYLTPEIKKNHRAKYGLKTDD